jgi:peptidoglycan/LPS O-acetylase OafA/YrhL
VDHQPVGSRNELLDRLSRRTTSGQYVPVIDGLRFVAILLVLVFHVSLVLDLILGRRTLAPPFGAIWGTSVTTLLGRAVWEMNHGVEVFFAVSGFVLSLPYVSARHRGTPKPTLRRYYLRRVTRIEPPYLVALSLLFVVSVLAANGQGFGHYVAGLVYLHSAWFGQGNPYDAVTWSLEVEIQFYILVPLLALALSPVGQGSKKMTCVIVASLAICAQLSGLIDGAHLFGFVGNYLQFFMVGWLLGDIYVVDWGAKPPQNRWWDVVTFVGWPALLVGLTIGSVFQVVVAPWLILGLTVAAFCGPLTRRVLSYPWIATIGGMCYSIYLTHYPVMILMRRWVAPIAGLPYPVALLLGALIMFPVVLLVGAVFFVTIERPCMDPDWARRVAERLGVSGGRSYSQPNSWHIRGSVAKQRDASARLNQIIEELTDK